MNNIHICLHLFLLHILVIHKYIYKFIENISCLYTFDGNWFDVIYWEWILRNKIFPFVGGFGLRPFLSGMYIFVFGDLLTSQTRKVKNQYNSLSLNMAAHIPSRRLRIRSFYYGKITNKKTQIKQHHTQWNQYIMYIKGFSITCLVSNPFGKLMKQIWNYNLDFVIPTLLNQKLTPVYVMAWRWPGARA